MLRRLDDIAAHLATLGDVLAVLGLGPAGAEHDRLDKERFTVDPVIAAEIESVLAR